MSHLDDLKRAIQYSQVIEPDSNQTEVEVWYRIQANHKWYYVLSCCRSCATRNLLNAISFGDFSKLDPSLWLVPASEVE